MRKIIEKIKEKGVKLSARIFGAMTACFSTIVAAYADAEEAGTDGIDKLDTAIIGRYR